jgi:hypothetical protein
VFEFAAVLDAVDAIDGVETTIAEESNALVVTSTRRARPGILVTAEGDTARVICGRVAQALAWDDEDSLDLLVRTVEAFDAGRVWEIYGYAADGTFGYLGSRIEAGNVVATRLDEGAREVLRVRL